MGKQIPMPCFSYGRNENAGNLFLRTMDLSIGITGKN